VVDRIDDVDDGVAVAVIFRPNGPDSALASEIPELQHGRGQRYLPSCTKRRNVCDARVYMTFNEEVASEERGGGAYCSGPPSGRFYLAADLACHYILSLSSRGESVGPKRMRGKSIVCYFLIA